MIFIGRINEALEDASLRCQDQKSTQSESISLRVMAWRIFGDQIGRPSGRRRGHDLSIPPSSLSAQESGMRLFVHVQLEHQHTWDEKQWQGTAEAWLSSRISIRVRKAHPIGVRLWATGIGRSGLFV